MKFNSLMLLAIGVGIGYFLASDEKGEIINSIKDLLKKGSDYAQDSVEKGKRVVSDFANKENY
ncbi:MAG: hypothetical protein ABIQ74_09970 [Chitinophagales bacterium]